MKFRVKTEFRRFQYLLDFSTLRIISDDNFNDFKSSYEKNDHHIFMVPINKF